MPVTWRSVVPQNTYAQNKGRSAHRRAVGAAPATPSRCAERHALLAQEHGNSQDGAHIVALTLALTALAQTEGDLAA